MNRTLTGRLVVSLLAVLLAGSGSLPAPAGAQAVPGGLAPDMSRTALEWRDCATAFFGAPEYYSDLGESACGVLTVPENWAHPGERQVDLQFVVLKATGEQTQPDPVVYLAGGPGGTTLAGVSGWAEQFAGLRTQRDIVLYDQRGTAFSSPLRCSSLTIDEFFSGSDESQAADLADAATPAPDELSPPESTGAPGDGATPDDGLGVAALAPSLSASMLMDVARAAVSDETTRCVQELLAQGVDLRQYNSMASATDLVALMQALDYETFNLYGISYGTRLALVTMRDYPNAGIRSVILDSTYPVGLPGFERYPSEPHEVVIQLFADCYLDAACNEAYPNLKARFIALLASLENQPLVVTDEMVITADDVVAVMQVISSAVAVAPYIPKMIAELEAGDATTYLGIVSGDLLTPTALAASATPEPGLAAATTSIDATPVADDEEVQAAVLRRVVQTFLQQIGIGDPGAALTPAQAFLSEVTFAINQLSTGPANELTVRLLLLDQLPATRATLAQFVDRAFTDPALADEQASLRQILATMTDADVAAVFDYLAGPLQVANPTSSNEFMYYSVECNESAPFQSFERTIETALELEIPALGLNTVASLGQIFAVCEIWPGGRAPSYANLPVSSEIPTLIFAGTYDMQTPLSWNKQAFVTLPNAGLVIVPMSGHGVLTYHPECITQISNDFMANPGYLPDDRCVAAYYPAWALPDADAG
ncbi:MAG: alpha/beta hydrolase [Thermomicrobiales bacterium]|nr:alpha/beta hydrolase [Thermomicrobiales bacterium]